MPAIARPSARRLTCKDPRVEENYITRYEKSAKKFDLQQKVTSLLAQASYPLSPDLQQTYKNLDNLHCKITAEAERKCHKLRIGQVAFSPALQEVNLQISAYTLLKKKCLGLRVSSRIFSQSLRKANLSKESYALDPKTIDSKLKESRLIKEYKERELQLSIARKVRYIRGKVRSGSTTLVQLSNWEGGTIDYVQKQDIEREILQSNEDKFKQSHHRPFFHSPFKNLFGWKGTTYASKLVLSRAYEPDNDILAREVALLLALQQPNNIHLLSNNEMVIYVQEYKSFWRKAKETTSCYPNELSFIAMKAGACSDLIAAIECNLANILIKTGYSPKRWKNCLDLMILKKSGLNSLNSLQTVVLFPVDFNFMFKNLGRKIMKNAEVSKALAPEHFGSRKCQRARALANNKSFTYDLMRQLNHTGAACSNDAKSCYGLIGHTQASLAMQHMGIPQAVVDCMFSTLQEPAHRVRTGYGDSSSYYGGKVWAIPIHGIGQGNGAGPAIWAIVMPLLNILRDKGYVMDYVTLRPPTNDALQEL